MFAVDLTLQELVRRLVEAYQPQRIYLFDRKRAAMKSPIVIMTFC